MKKCKNADKYKGIHPPTCNGGDPCDACKEKYREVHKLDDLPIHNCANFLDIDIDNFIGKCKLCEKEYTQITVEIKYLVTMARMCYALGKEKGENPYGEGKEGWE